MTALSQGFNHYSVPIIGVEVPKPDTLLELTPAGSNARRWYCGVGMGTWLLFVAVSHTFLFFKFTPVYSATECGNQTPLLDDFSIDQNGIHVGLEIDVTCQNPNPYRINILESEPGRVLVGNGGTKLQVGYLNVIPGSFIEQRGSGVIRVRMDATISGEKSVTLLPHFLEDAEVTISIELKFSVGITISFGILGSWGTTAPFQKDCGLNIAGVLVQQYKSTSGKSTRLGPLICRDSFEGLVVPSINQDPSLLPDDGNMGFTAAQVAPEEVRKGEMAKNISLGTIISLSYLGSVVIIFHTLIGCSCLCCSAPLKKPSHTHQLIASEEPLEEGLKEFQAYERPRHAENLRKLTEQRGVGDPAGGPPTIIADSSAFAGIGDLEQRERPRAYSGDSNFSNKVGDSSSYQRLNPPRNQSPRPRAGTGMSSASSGSGNVPAPPPPPARSRRSEHDEAKIVERVVRQRERSSSNERRNDGPRDDRLKRDPPSRQISVDSFMTGVPAALPSAKSGVTQENIRSNPSYEAT